MDIKELYNLVHTISDIVTKHNYVTAINQLKANVTQYKNYKVATPQTLQIQQQIPASKTRIETSRMAALTALNEILPGLRDYNLARVIQKLKLDHPFNDYAVSLLTRIPSELDTNIDGLISELNTYYQRVISYQQFINTVNTVLGDIPPLTNTEETDQLIIFFEGEANVDNLKELAKVSNEWNQIVNCFGRLTRENNTDIRIVSIERGSLVETLAIASLIIGGIIKASNKVLELILKAYEVKKKALELKQMKLDSIAKAIEILDKQSQINLTDEAKRIVNDLMQEYGWDVGNEDYNVTETATIKGVKKLIKFHNTGGKLDAKLLTPSEEAAAEVHQLKERNIEFLNAEAEVARLTTTKQILQIEDGNAHEEVENEEIENEDKHD